MKGLNHKICLLHDEDIDVYFKHNEAEKGDRECPSYEASITLAMVKKNGIEIGTTTEEEEELINQIEIQ